MRKHFLNTSLMVLVSMLAVSTTWAGQYKMLRPTAEIPQLATLQETWESAPRRAFRVEGGTAAGRPLYLGMEEVGVAASERVVVMLHGVLSNRQAWRFVAADLAGDHTVLLVDLLGCGESDRPNPKKLDGDAYSPTAQARYVLTALRSYLEKNESVRNLTLVGHSLGGTVAMSMLGDRELRRQFSTTVGKIDRSVLVAPMDFAIERVHPTFDQIVKLGRTKVALAAGLGILKNKVAKSSRHGYSDPESAAREETRRQIQILRQKDTRRAAQAMILQAVPFDLKARRPDWPAIEQLVANYQNVDVPTLILWGSRDETLPVSMGHKLQDQLPQAWLRVVEKSMHSLPIERPYLCAAQIRQFGNGSSQTQASVENIQIASKPAAQQVSDRQVGFVALAEPTQ